MIIVIALIGVAVLVVGHLVWDEFDTGREVCGGVSTAVLVLSVVSTICLGVALSRTMVADQKITMYKEENAKIEEQISEVVRQYQEYEYELFTEVAPESAITLVAIYPELKADTLVAKQIEVYLENNERIKALREQEINRSVFRWWLFFGK